MALPPQSAKCSARESSADATRAVYACTRSGVSMSREPGVPMSNDRSDSSPVAHLSGPDGNGDGGRHVEREGGGAVACRELCYAARAAVAGPRKVCQRIRSGSSTRGSRRGPGLPGSDEVHSRDGREAVARGVLEEQAGLGPFEDGRGGEGGTCVNQQHRAQGSFNRAFALILLLLLLFILFLLLQRTVPSARTMSWCLSNQRSAPLPRSMAGETALRRALSRAVVAAFDDGEGVG